MRKLYGLLIAGILVLGACADDTDTKSNHHPADASPDTTSDAPDARNHGLAVHAIEPEMGGILGGDSVVISGAGFQDGAKVYFGLTEADTTFVSDVELGAITPRVPDTFKADIHVKNPDGTQATLSDAFQYIRAGKPQRTIGWCNIERPEALVVEEGSETEAIFGRVYVEGCTEGVARCEQVRAELGYGGGNDDPSADPDAWTWTPARYNPDHLTDRSDEYRATLTPDITGIFLAYSYRFSLDDGATWSYCNLGDTDAENPFSTERMGDLRVTEKPDEPDPTPAAIGWCTLRQPAAISTAPGAETEAIYGRVYSPGCTDDGARCAALSAEVGYAPIGAANPSDDDSAYTWVPAAYNPAHTGDDHNEFQTTLISPPDAGDYVYVYRFSGDAGAHWLYCDLDGSSNGFQVDQQGGLTVTD